MKKMIALAMFMALAVSSAYAVDALTASGSGSKTLSYVEFTSIPENHGMPYRVVQKRYEDYRQGLFPIATLDTSKIR